MKTLRMPIILAIIATLSLGLAACGGGSSSSSEPTASSPTSTASSPTSTASSPTSTASSPTSVTYSISGTLTGLAGGQQITLLNNGSDALTVTASGSFTFATSIASGGAYTVTVGTQPVGQFCTVTNGTGTASANVTNVSVNCAAVTESVLWSFGGTGDGAEPAAGLIMDSAGNLYGTASVGGVTISGGTVFKITPSGAESVLLAFDGTSAIGTNPALGVHPAGGLIMDSSGNLYGTTNSGGAHGAGTVFKISPSGTATVLHSFGALNSGDGQYPMAGLIMDSAGNLYGTTNGGGTTGYGTVFKITPSGTESVLWSFDGTTSSADGYSPMAPLIMDSAGNLYGTTYSGGTSDGGTVFKITPSGTESILWSFSFNGTGAGTGDGYDPVAGLTMDSAGNLYGTTLQGGAFNQGTVFKITPSGTESVLWSFGGPGDGSEPSAGLIMDSAGNLYGTTKYGGAYSNSPNGGGTVFEITPSGTESVLWSFGGTNTDGGEPLGGLIMDSSGSLYGTTLLGGAYSANGTQSGTVFKLN